MATIKISELPAVSTPIINTDLFNTSKDLGGSYESQKATATNLGTYVQNNVVVNSSSYSVTSSHVIYNVNSASILPNNSLGLYRGVDYVGDGVNNAESLCNNIIYAGRFSGNDWALQISNSISQVKADVPTVIKIGSGIKFNTTASVPIILKPYCGLEFEIPTLLELGDQYIELNLCSFILGYRNKPFRSDSDPYTNNSFGTTFVCNTDFYNNNSSGSCIITKDNTAVKSIVLSDFQITRNRQVSCVQNRKAIYIKQASDFILKNILISLFRNIGTDYGTGILLTNITGSNTAWGDIDSISVGDCGYGIILDGSPSLTNTVGYCNFKRLYFGGCKHSLYLKGALNNKFNYITVQGDTDTGSSQIWIESVTGAAGGGGGGTNNWFEWIDIDGTNSTQNIKLDVVGASNVKSNKFLSKDALTISSSVGYSGLNQYPIYEQSLVPGTDSIINLTQNYTQNTGSDVKVYINRGAGTGRTSALRIAGHGLTDANSLDMNVASNGTSLIRYNGSTMIGFSTSHKYIHVPIGSIQCFATGDGRLGSVVKVNSNIATSSLVGNECGIATFYSGSFSTNGDSATYTSYGIIGSSVSLKRIQLYWSGSSGLLLADSSASFASVSASWMANAMITRRSTSNQILSGELKIINTDTNILLFNSMFCKSGSFSFNRDNTLSVVLTSDSTFNQLSHEHSIAEWKPSK